jgi:hypothetical protein
LGYEEDGHGQRAEEGLMSDRYFWLPNLEVRIGEIVSVFRERRNARRTR